MTTNFGQLSSNDKKIDTLLMVVGDGVIDLKNIATEMSHETKAQSQQLTQLEVVVDKTDDKIEQNTERLKPILDKHCPFYRIFAIVICLLVLAGLGSVIYLFFT